MGRIEANSTPNTSQSRSSTDEFRFRPGTQGPETIDTVPPPPLEIDEENQHQNYQKHKTGPSRTTFENLENQHVTFPTPGATQAVQFPPENAENRVKRSQIPPRNSPQAFPPPESYPPQKPGAFPPPGNDQIHSFPPQARPVNYPPYQQVFAQPNVAQYTPPATNYSYAAANMNGVKMGLNSQGVPGSPYGNNLQPGIPVMNPTPGFNLPTQAWRSSLFDCMNDPENAIITACLPCVTFGQIAEIIDEGQTTCGTSGALYGVIAFCIAMPCLISCGYRMKLRSKLGLMETPAPDWIVHCFCEWCALCQEYRELKGRGMDPAIGARSDYPTVASWRRILIKVSFSSRCQPIGILLPCFGGRLRSFWRPFTDRPSSCCSENALANSGGSIFSSGDVLISGLGWYILNGGCSRSAAVSTLVLGGGFSSMVIFRSTVGVSPAVTIISRVVWFLHWECVSNHVGVFCFSCWPAFWRNYSALASVWFLFSVDFAIVCIGFAVLIHVKSSSRLATLVVMHSLADIILTVDVIPFGLLHCACRTVVSCWLYGVVYRLGLVLPCFFFLRWLVTDVGAPYYGWISSRGFNCVD